MLIKGLFENRFTLTVFYFHGSVLMFLWSGGPDICYLSNRRDQPSHQGRKCLVLPFGLAQAPFLQEIGVF